MDRGWVLAVRVALAQAVGALGVAHLSHHLPPTKAEVQLGRGEGEGGGGGMAFLSGQPSLCAADQPLLVERLELLELCRRLDVVGLSRGLAVLPLLRPAHGGEALGAGHAEIYNDCL